MTGGLGGSCGADTCGVAITGTFNFLSMASTSDRSGAPSFGCVDLLTSAGFIGAMSPYLGAFNGNSTSFITSRSTSARFVTGAAEGDFAACGIGCGAVRTGASNLGTGTGGGAGAGGAGLATGAT